MAVNTTQWFDEQLAQARLLPVSFGQRTWLLDGRGVAYLPHKDLLVVSDLHLEKGSFLGSFGHPIPHFDSRATLDRLAAIIDDYQPSTLMCLGDSFHDANSLARMQSQDVDHLRHLISSVPRWQWVLGNHDPHIPPQLAGERWSRLCIDTIGFCHEPEVNWSAASYQVIGHFHPKVRHRAGRQSVTGRCFALAEKIMILPAFGQYTGGLWVEHEVMQPLIPAAQRRCFILQPPQIFALQQ